MDEQQNSTPENTVEPGFSPKPMMLSEEDFLDASSDVQPSPSGSHSPSPSPGEPPTETPDT
jgi:hypothetical protein